MSHHRHFGGNFPRNIGWDKLIGGFVPPIRKLWWDNPTEFGHNNAGNRARERLSRSRECCVLAGIVGCLKERLKQETVLSSQYLCRVRELPMKEGEKTNILPTDTCVLFCVRRGIAFIFVLRIKACSSSCQLYARR